MILKTNRVLAVRDHQDNMERRPLDSMARLVGTVSNSIRLNRDMANSLNMVMVNHPLSRVMGKVHRKGTANNPSKAMGKILSRAVMVAQLHQGISLEMIVS
jgi:hypothetical protein